MITPYGTLQLPPGQKPQPGSPWNPANEVGIPRPVGAWLMNEGAGLQAWDASGNGNHGTIQGTVNWVSDSLAFGTADANYLKLNPIGYLPECTQVVVFTQTGTPSNYSCLMVDSDAAGALNAGGVRGFMSVGTVLRWMAGKDWGDPSSWCGTLLPPTGTESIIVGMRYADMRIECWLNGVLSGTNTGNVGTWPAAKAAGIGGYPANSDYPANVRFACVLPVAVGSEMAKKWSLSVGDLLASWRPRDVWWYAAAGGAGTYTVALQDSLGLADALTPVGAYAASLADDIAAADALTVLAAYGVTLVDSMTAADTEAAVAAFLTSLADDATLADAITAAFAGAISVADTLGAGDTIVLQAAYQASLSGTLTTADTIAAIGAYLATLTDSVTAADVLAIVQAHAAALADSLTFGDAITAVTTGEATYTVTLADTLGFADALWLMLPVALTFLLAAVGRRFDTAEAGRRFSADEVGRRFDTEAD